MKHGDYYYHAGVKKTSGEIKWSSMTRLSAGTAEAEAWKMSRASGGGTGVVEFWERRHGFRPGDCELVEGYYEI